MIISRPMALDEHWTLILVACIGLIGTTVTAVFSYLAQRAAAHAEAHAKRTGERVDGRMDEMLALARAEALAEKRADEG